MECWSPAIQTAQTLQGQHNGLDSESDEAVVSFQTLDRTPKTVNRQAAVCTAATDLEINADHASIARKGFSAT